MNNHIYIDRFLNDPTTKNMDQIIKLGRSESFSDDELAKLSVGLAMSGHSLTIPKNVIAADIPSTGGPSSLTTLICPLVLRELGFWVPKLGVRGRPAGGIDVLYQIPGYKIDFNQNELSSCLANHGYCHFLADAIHAPLDAILFKYRFEVGATAVPSLVISSILSKKIAVGLSVTGLDVRVSRYGNFGKNWTEAISNSQRFINVASLVGIKAKCMLNDFNFIQQPYIGRGEALVALKKIFTQNSYSHLQTHLERCISMAFELKTIYNLDHKNLSRKLKYHFKLNLNDQGGSWQGFLQKAKEVEEDHNNILSASKTGFIRINPEKLKHAIIWGQKKFDVDGKRFSDPCGVIIKKMDNDLINKGDTILTYRAEAKISSEFKRRIANAIKINSRTENYRNYEVYV